MNEKKGEVKNKDEDSQDDKLVVNVDVHLDNDVGELVPNAETTNDIANEEKSKVKNSLVEAVESSNTAEDEVPTTS